VRISRQVEESNIIAKDSRILVTGSNGFLGVRVVAELLRRGYRNVRCFVRPSSKLARLQEVIAYHGAEREVELVVGDLLSRDDCRKAADGVAVVCHLAAGFDKAFAGAFMNSALGTRNLLEAFLEQGHPARFVQVSSFAVYSNLNLPRHALLDESCPLENSPQERYDAYAFGKLKQEELVRDFGLKHGVPFVILRPGTVFGPGKRDLTGRIGVDTFGFLLHVGGRNRLPLTYVENCAEAIVLAGLKAGVDGETFNVVDDDLLTSHQFLKAWKKRTGKRFSVRLPYFLAYGFSCLWEDWSKRRKGQLPPAFNRRRCAAEWKGNQFTNRKLKDRLGWRPRVGMDDAMEAFLSQFDHASS
jgi:nucleoside-diphosphate-sugar epimerase